MMKVGRRSLLRGLIATPAISLLGRTAVSQAVPTPAPTPTGGYTLYVFFHGPFIFSIDKNANYIEARTPKTGNHDYWAGNFNYDHRNYDDLTTLPVGSLAIQGLYNGSIPTPDNSHSIVLDGNDTSTIKSIGKKGHTYCTITFPLPKDMQPVCVSDIESGKTIFKGHHSQQQNSRVKCVPYTYVLAFGISDLSALAVYGIPQWKPIWHDDGSGNRWATLHFIVWPNSPDSGGGHARTAFDNEADLLEGLDLHLDEKGVTDDPYKPNYIVLPSDLSDWICPEKGDVDAKKTQFKGKPKIETSMAGVPAHCRAPAMIVTKG